MGFCKSCRYLICGIKRRRKMRLIITRHGETKENRARVVQGRLHGTLSELGVKQAKKVAERLRDERIDGIFSSDLRRAADTAKEISKFHPEIPLNFVKDLRERDLGPLEGHKLPAELRPKRWDSEFASNLGIETPEEIFERAKKFINSLLKEYYKKTVLLVAHNGINQAIITHLLGKSWGDIGELNLLGNTSITIFELDKNKKPIVKLMNCMRHLGD